MDIIYNSVRVLNMPGCYESVAQAERKSAAQGLGLVKTDQIDVKVAIEIAMIISWEDFK